MDQDTPLQKFIVIISALIVFTIGMMIGINIIGYFVGPDANPYLVKGLIPGNTPLIIQQDPNVKGSIPVERADNQEYGLEFSWAVWLNITDLGKTGEYQHIFHIYTVYSIFCLSTFIKIITVVYSYRFCLQSLQFAVILY